jgi:hypothetical protein
LIDELERYGEHMRFTRIFTNQLSENGYFCI